MCRVRYITPEQSKREIEERLASAKRYLELAVSERHKQEILQVIADTEKELKEVG